MMNQSALPAPVGNIDSWNEPASGTVPEGFGNVEGFEAGKKITGVIKAVV
jgi:hypothetical protein